MNKMFFMVRHGETLANKNGVAAGIFDTPLTEIGKQQAMALEEVIYQSGISLNYMVHSGLSRSTDTAKLLNRRLSLPLLGNNELAEQNFGDWQGDNWRQVMARVRSGKQPPKGEALTIFYKRAMSGIKTAIYAMTGTPILVTHGGVFDAFFSCCALKEIDVENCVLYQLSLEETDSTVIGTAEKYAPLFKKSVEHGKMITRDN